MLHIIKLFLFAAYFSGIAQQIAIRAPKSETGPATAHEAVEAEGVAKHNDDKETLAEKVEKIRAASEAHWWQEYERASAQATAALQRETAAALRIAWERNTAAQRAAEAVALQQVPNRGSSPSNLGAAGNNPSNPSEAATQPTSEPGEHAAGASVDIEQLIAANAVKIQREYEESTARAAESIRRETQEALARAQRHNAIAQRSAERVARQQNGLE